MQRIDLDVLRTALKLKCAVRSDLFYGWLVAKPARLDRRRVNRRRQDMDILQKR